MMATRTSLAAKYAWKKCLDSVPDVVSNVPRNARAYVREGARSTARDELWFSCSAVVVGFGKWNRLWKTLLCLSRAAKKLFGTSHPLVKSQGRLSRSSCCLVLSCFPLGISQAAKG
jgi:hypothetical protein